MLKFAASALSYALAAFGGTISVWGMMHFAPGAEFVIAIMGGLFEMSKLAAYTFVGHRFPWYIKAPLVLVSLVLATLNVVGLNGFLARSFEQAQITASANSRTAEVGTKAQVTALEQQVQAAEARITKATEAMAKAKGDRDQIKAVRQMVTDATNHRNAAAEKLAAAQVNAARAEGATIAANGEMASIIALATVLQMDVNTVAHRVFLAIAIIPEVLEALFAIIAGFLGRRKGEVQAQVVTETVFVVEPVLVTESALHPAEVIAEVPAEIVLTPGQVRARKGVETKRRNAEEARKQQIVEKAKATKARNKANRLNTPNVVAFKAKA